MAREKRVGNGSVVASRIPAATLVAGTLDIVWAAMGAALAGRPIAGMLRAIASGPFPGASGWGDAGAAVGLLVHFTIMSMMATMFLLAHERIASVRRNPVLAGAAYGVALWLVMYGLVLPLRFGVRFPSTDPMEIAKQLFAHVVLVGLIFAVVARRAPSAEA